MSTPPSDARPDPWAPIPRPDWSRRVRSRPASPLGRLLGINPRTWQRWLAAGIVPGAYRMGHRWRIEHEAAQALLDGKVTIDARGVTKKGAPAPALDFSEG